MVFECSRWLGCFLSGSAVVSRPCHHADRTHERDEDLPSLFLFDVHCPSAHRLHFHPVHPTPGPLAGMPVQEHATRSTWRVLQGVGKKSCSGCLPWNPELLLRICSWLNFMNLGLSIKFVRWKSLSGIGVANQHWRWCNVCLVNGTGRLARVGCHWG